jgi:hypothetical protein
MDYEALDGAMMVLVGEDDFGEVIIISWHGLNKLQWHDDTIQVCEIRNYDTPIRDSSHARVLAKDWLADIIVENERLQEEDGA